MKKYIYILLVMLLFGSLFLLYKELTYTHVTVKFKELRPFEKSIPVYYKGLVIGRARECRHSEDYSHTLMKVVLYPKNLHLPSNTTVWLAKIVKNKKEYDFLELVYPKEPTNELIINGTVLEGRATVDMEAYMKNQNPEDLESIRANLMGASENLNMTVEALGQFFILLQDLVKENQANLVGATTNLRESTDNINQMISKFNRSIDENKLSNTFTNIENSTGNLQRFTDSVNISIDGVNKTIPQVNSTLENTQELIENANAISCGIRQTLSKPFGGLRLIFGKTINE